ncbi:uncharacterized protein [Atheta coriaria]|uniref:uncharacterized protein isoform X2 n=1 Tax=Dalotia coriaria TaxID=877792 RepID=UPI0031F3D23D
MLLQAQAAQAAVPTLAATGHSGGGSVGKAASIFNGLGHAEARAHMLDYAPAPGWTVHVNKDGRLYYCNHVTKTASWLPPAEAWRAGEDTLPYGWERALDDSGRSYYINHVNKTTTYEMPVTRALHPSEAPEPRSVTLDRSAALGFGFVAGSEKPVIVRFVTEGGPSVDKLLPGDQIIEVNGEDVKIAPREHVISLIRACSSTVSLVVCQPQEQAGARKSTLLSASKRARLRTKPSRVRFAESVCVNGAPLFPPSAFSLGDLCVAPMANVLKVFLENGQTKSFKYDAWTTVQDVVASLQAKLCLSATEHFSLVVEHIKSLKRNKLTLLDPADTLARIASRPGAHKLRCLYRIAYVPTSAAALAQLDLVALDYLFTQCCNDVIQERFAPELQYDTALRLAALHVYQHALANNMQASKLTVKTVEREFGLERFVPASLLEKMKRKEVRKLVAHFLKLHSTMAGPGKQLTALQAKLHYLDIVSQLPSYGAKCFSAGPKADVMERVILVSPKFGISQITGSRNSVPQPIANIEDIRSVEVRAEDELMHNVCIHLKNDQIVSVTLEERDANELVLVLKGYYRLSTENNLIVEKEESEVLEDLAPPYLSQHKVVPDRWSYLNQQQVKSVMFTIPPTYQHLNRKTNGLYNTMGRQSKPLLTGFSLDSNMNSSIVKNNEIKRDVTIYEAKNDFLREQLKSSAEWQETSVDIESDTDSLPTEEHTLRHSDSLLLLAKGAKEDSEHLQFTNAAIEMLRSEVNYSESDNDSVYTPHNSPKHLNNGGDSEIANGGKSRISFGLHSPDSSTNCGSQGQESQELRAYLEKLKQSESSRVNDDVNLYFDPDIIDLTMLPPPGTPDELDGALPPAIDVPPHSFADSMEKLNKLGVLHENLDLEEFLASVTILPPTLKVTPAVELTPEEIMSYIIPPPPDIRESPEVPPKPRRASAGTGTFSCCGGGGDKNSDDGVVALPPRRGSIEEKPPDRPPKTVAERQRSQSMLSTFKDFKVSKEVPPKLPPRADDSSQLGQAHLFLPPKKPPLPPLPPLEVLRSRKNTLSQTKTTPEVRTAGIGSPHLQRNKNMYNDLDLDAESNVKVGCTAVSTPTSPFLDGER